MSLTKEETIFAIQFSRKQVASWLDQNLVTTLQNEAIQKFLEEYEEQFDPQHSSLLNSNRQTHELIVLCWNYLRERMEEAQSQGIISVEDLQKLQYEIDISITDKLDERKQQQDSSNEHHGSVMNTQSRNLVERLLDPKTLHILMSCGGGILIVGLISWLWAIGLFDNPRVVAVCFGVGNLSIISAGVIAVRASQYRIAGRGVALLGCLMLPLNLWFYDAQGLITLNDGGHLWVPALFCCLIYAAVARFLKDHWFVYTFVAGVAMTGLLILADHQVARFWEILAPSTLLVAIGVLSVHAERLFSISAKVFNRQTFGKAFFNAGHIALAAGLSILFGGRVVGQLYDSTFAHLGWFAVPDVVVIQQVQLVAMILTLVATYTYVYSQLICRQGGRYIYSAILMFLWSEVILFDLLSIAVTETSFLILIASTGIIANLTTWALKNRLLDNSDDSLVILNKAMLGLGTLSTLTAAGVATLQFLRFFLFGESGYFSFALSNMSVVSLALSIIACGSAALTSRQSVRFLSKQGYLATTAVLILFGMLEGSTMAGIEWSFFLPTVASLLLICSFSFLIVESKVVTNVFRHVFQSVGIMLLSVSAIYWTGWTPHELTPEYAHELGCLMSLVLAGFFGVLTALSAHKLHATLAVVCTWSGLWNGLIALGFISYAPILAASALGVIAVMSCRVMSSWSTDLEKTVRQLGVATLTLGGVAGVLLLLNRVVGGEANWELFVLMIGQMAAALVSGVTLKDEEQRRGMWGLAGAHVLGALLIVNVLSTLTLPQRFELFSTIFGILMLIYGYVARSQEEEIQMPSVSFNLRFGSVLATAPIIMGMLATRIWGSSAGWGWLMFHEIGTLLIGMILLGSGLICRIRSTTLAGGAAICIYILSLITLIQVPDQLQTTAVYMMVGGGMFFGSALLMSIYRDRLLAVPGQMREGKGMFRVLKWR